MRARARLALAEGDPAAARGAWEEALALAAKMGDAHTIAALRRQLASI